LSDEQAEQVRDLKYALKKRLIGEKAGKQTMMLDMKHDLHGENPDAEAVKKDIDAGFAKMAEAAKAHVDAYMELRGILTEEQTAKLKGLCFKSRKLSAGASRDS